MMKKVRYLNMQKIIKLILTGEVHSLTIIARAILLLRFCCGACSFLFKKNSISKNDLDFYIHKVGQSYGIWDTVNPEESQGPMDGHK